MKQEYALVVLAAGIGSRFGGVKQLKPVGPAGEIIMDYSVYDALEAGFNKIVFIIRKDIETDFRQTIGNRIETVCARRGVEVSYAFQERENLPGGYVCPAERTKPWGTGHAMLACRGLLDGPFVVLNADDYYGREVFRTLLAWLKALPADSRGNYCLAGFRLGNTLSDYGGVTRGICTVDERGQLLQLSETKNIVRTETGAAFRDADRATPLDLTACVSMNMWGFTPDLLDSLEEQFKRFLQEHRTESGAEFLLPVAVDHMLASKQARVQVLPTEDTWFGMTYQEDVSAVTAAFRDLTRRGIYRPGLYEGALEV